MARVEKMEHGCWEWRGTINDRGYGLVGCEGRPQRAHRVAYKLFVGPLRDDQELRHSCDNPPCVRPDHLSTGTHEDNMQDAAERGRMPSGDRHWTGRELERDKVVNAAETARRSLPSGDQHWTHRDLAKAQRNAEAMRGQNVRGSQHGQAKLTEALVIEIRTQAAQGATSADLATTYGVSRGVIREAIQGITWAHVPGAMPEFLFSTLVQGEAHGNAKVTPDLVREIRALGASGQRHADIAERFGISKATVQSIVARTTWAHVS